MNQITQYQKFAGIARTGTNFLLKRDKVFGLPTHILIEFSSVCNLGCPACPRTNNPGPVRKDRYIETEKFKYIVNEIMPTVLGIGGLGEPLLAPNAFELIRYCKDKRINTYLTTNGTLLEAKHREIVQSGLNQLSVSIDGPTSEIYEKIRCKKYYNKIIGGIKKINEYKIKLKTKKPLLAIHVVVQEDNYRHLASFVELAYRMDVKKVFFLQIEREIYQNNEALFTGIDKSLLSSQLIEADSRAIKYGIQTNISFWKNNFNELKKKYQKRNGYPLSDKICVEPWSTMFINLGGDIFPCCALQSQKGRVGNIFDKPIRDIWNGRPIAKFRHAVKNKKKTFFRCKECIPRSVIDILNDFKRREVI